MKTRKELMEECKKEFANFQPTMKNSEEITQGVKKELACLKLPYGSLGKYDNLVTRLCILRTLYNIGTIDYKLYSDIEFKLVTDMGTEEIMPITECIFQRSDVFKELED